MTNIKKGILLLVCSVPFGFACVGDFSALDGEGMIYPDDRPVAASDVTEDSKDQPSQFCDGPTCDGSTGQGPELEGLVINQVELGGQTLLNAHAWMGEVRGYDPESPRSILDGTRLKGAILWGPVPGSGDPQGTLSPPPLKYRIADVVRVADQTIALDSSDSWHSLFGDGTDQTTHLYSIEIETTEGWKPACSTAPDETAFANWAIPVSAVWQGDGSRIDSYLPFTMACMNGVIAKCYRWGYRPWVDGSMRDAHQACTRMARADYCGNGESHTEPGTIIYIQDYNLASMIRTFVGTPAYMTTEALWGPDGAYCASQRRAGTDWPDWDQDLQAWCGNAINAYGSPWQECDTSDPTVHGLPSTTTPYLANKSEWEPPILAP